MDEQNPEYTECYVAFLDILGFEALVERSKKEPEILRRLVLSLNELADLAPPEKSVRDLSSGNEKHWRMQVRSFSDSIALFVPTESELIGSFLESIGFLYGCLLEMDTCLRGAVTIGDMYWHDGWSRENSRNEISPENGDEERILYERFSKSDLPITLGPGLVDAYKLECSEAKYPRILITKTLFEHIHKLEREEPVKRVPASPLCSPDPKNSDLWITDFVEQDLDRVRFLDILNSRWDHRHVVRQTISRTEDGGSMRRNKFNDQSREDWLLAIRKFIADSLRTHRGTSVEKKYVWFAKYLNKCLATEESGSSSVEPLPII